MRKAYMHVHSMPVPAIPRLRDRRLRAWPRTTVVWGAARRRRVTGTFDQLTSERRPAALARNPHHVAGPRRAAVAQARHRGKARTDGGQRPDLEINYNFAFSSHPELRDSENNALRVEDARDLAATCRRHGRSPDPDVQLPGPPVVGADHVSLADQAPRVRRVARCRQGQSGNLLPELVPAAPRSQQGGLRA